MNPDIRWKQRFENYRRALATLQGASALAQQRPLTELTLDHPALIVHIERAR
jgi:hypothetical protein